MANLAWNMQGQGVRSVQRLFTMTANIFINVNFILFINISLSRDSVVDPYASASNSILAKLMRIEP